MSDSPQPPFVRHSDGSVDEGRNVLGPSNLLNRLAGLDLAFIRVAHQTGLRFGEFEVTIESPFRLTAPDGTEHSLDPGRRSHLGPLLDLYPDSIVTAAVDAGASLWLRLGSGAQLVVPADPQFEAWQVSGPHGFLVVCATGGAGLAVWGAAQ